MATWAWLERFFTGSGVVPLWFFLTAIGLTVAHLGYYVWFLNLFKEQQSVYLQLNFPCLIHASSFIPADLIVGGLAFAACHRLPLAREVFSRPSNRLFLVWFLVSFALAHHEFAFRPRQPAHFSRGYTWVPLFLIGVGPMLSTWKFLLSIQAPIIRIVGIGAVLLFFLSDNILWFASRTVGRYVAAGSEENSGSLPDYLYNGEMMDARDYAFYIWLNQRPEHTELLVSKDPRIGYLALTYTPFRTWYSHQLNTPFSDQRRQEIEDYYSSGKIPSGWMGRKLFVILPNEEPHWEEVETEPLPEVYRNDKYHVVMLDLSAQKG
jgi:hypothetical protein